MTRNCFNCSTRWGSVGKTVPISPAHQYQDSSRREQTWSRCRVLLSVEKRRETGFFRVWGGKWERMRKTAKGWRFHMKRNQILQIKYCWKKIYNFSQDKELFSVCKPAVKIKDKGVDFGARPWSCWRYSIVGSFERSRKKRRWVGPRGRCVGRRRRRASTTWRLASFPKSSDSHPGKTLHFDFFWEQRDDGCIASWIIWSNPI